ncbi:MAG: hypothetical protein KC589_09165 [Nanoarchaeota archaeon]|nr:hypothetical protein [Nanoarchaeota archaeon]
MEKEKVTQLKKITLDEPTFVANGNNYFIEPELSIDRFKEMQKIEIEFSFGVSYRELFNGMKSCYETINKGQFGDTAIKMHNLMSSVSGIDDREHPMLRYCAMFINREGEDRRLVDEKVMNEKIEDWRIEGISMNDFFKLAVNMVSGLKENYLHYIQSISQEVKGEEKA